MQLTLTTWVSFDSRNYGPAAVGIVLQTLLDLACLREGRGHAALSAGFLTVMHLSGYALQDLRQPLHRAGTDSAVHRLSLFFASSSAAMGFCSRNTVYCSDLTAYQDASNFYPQHGTCISVYASKDLKRCGRVCKPQDKLAQAEHGLHRLALG